MASSSVFPLHIEAPLGDLAVGGVGTRAAAARLLEDVLLAHDAANLEVAADVVLVQDELDLQVDLGGAAQPGLGRGQALAQLLQLLDSGGDVAQAPGVLAQRQQRAPDPDDGPGLHRRPAARGGRTSSHAARRCSAGWAGPPASNRACGLESTRGTARPPDGCAASR